MHMVQLPLYHKCWRMVVRVYRGKTVSVSLIWLALLSSSLQLWCLQENLFCCMECALICNFVPCKKQSVSKPCLVLPMWWWESCRPLWALNGLFTCTPFLVKPGYGPLIHDWVYTVGERTFPAVMLEQIFLCNPAGQDSFWEQFRYVVFSMTRAANTLLRNKYSTVYGISYRGSKAYTRKDMQQWLGLPYTLTPFHSLCALKKKS